MPYSRSQARKRFESEIAIVMRTVREAHSAKCSVISVREFALYSAVVLTSAKLESYIEDLLASWGVAVQANGITTDRLPRSTRAFLLAHPGLTPAYRRFVAEDDESFLLDRLENLLSDARYDFAIDGRPLPQFPARMIYADRKYPSPRNLKLLFKRLGISNVFHALNRLGRYDAEASLTSFNDLRTEMAHVGMPVGLSADDIKRKIRELQRLVGYVDRVFFEHVRQTVGSACWKC